MQPFHIMDRSSRPEQLLYNWFIRPTRIHLTLTFMLDPNTGWSENDVPLKLMRQQQKRMDSIDLFWT